MRKNLRTILVIGVLSILGVVLPSGTALQSQRVGTDQTCQPDNPDCGGGGGGGNCGPIPCDCSTGQTVGISQTCSVCAYNPIMRQYLYDGTRITTKQCCGNSCPCSTIQCWQGLGCGQCF
jgi:hypothetical protein